MEIFILKIRLIIVKWLSLISTKSYKRKLNETVPWIPWYVIGYHPMPYCVKYNTSSSKRETPLLKLVHKSIFRWMHWGNPSPSWSNSRLKLKWGSYFVSVYNTWPFEKRSEQGWLFTSNLLPLQDKRYTLDRNHNVLKMNYFYHNRWSRYTHHSEV